jgi:7,8-dihydroneopterin aldolase/epimerase/oxygenase
MLKGFISKITITDLEVFYCVGVTDEERAKPQRLLVTVDMAFDVSSAATSDRIEKTINYQQVADEVLKYGEGRNWKLIERLASNLADFVLAEYHPEAVLVEVKKFVVPQARHVSVTVTKTRQR